MNDKTGNVAVVYLSWLPYGISHFYSFVESYKKYSAGVPHQLIIAFNGHDEKFNAQALDAIKYLEQAGITATYLYFSSGQDIVIYKKVVDKTDAGHYLFLNTYSRLLAADWLVHYVSNWKNAAGLIGASASFANYYTAIKVQLKATLAGDAGLKKKFGELKYFLKLFFLYKNKFSGFPSPHIRTNGFFTSKKIFSSLSGTVISNKMEAYYFENGKNNLTEQVQNLGYDCFLVDKQGKTYSINDWVYSKIFWKARQEDLLISDNQTRKYDEASAKEKQLLTEMAWGRNR